MTMVSRSISRQPTMVSRSVSTIMITCSMVCVCFLSGHSFTFFLDLIDPPLSPPIEDPNVHDLEQLQMDDIRTEYHPKSGCRTKTERFHEYKRSVAPENVSPPPNKEPWRPFISREDFEFAEVVLDAALNKDQVNTLIKLMHHCANGQSSFNIRSHSELCAIWKKASGMLTPVSTHIIVVLNTIVKLMKRS